MRSLDGMGSHRWSHCDWRMIVLCFITNDDLVGPTENERARLSGIPWVVLWSQATER